MNGCKESTVYVERRESALSFVSGVWNIVQVLWEKVRAGDGRGAVAVTEYNMLYSGKRVDVAGAIGNVPLGRAYRNAITSGCLSFATVVVRAKLPWREESRLGCNAVNRWCRTGGGGQGMCS